jgi:hypothetical protein
MRNAIVASIFVTAACHHESRGTTTTTGAGILGSDDAAMHLTAGRCEREMDCKNIGTGKRFEDRGACERAVADDLQAAMRPPECTYGIREDRMNECLEEMKNEKCANPLDEMSRLTTCRTSRLCLR